MPAKSFHLLRFLPFCQWPLANRRAPLNVGTIGEGAVYMDTSAGFGSAPMVGVGYKRMLATPYI